MRNLVAACLVLMAASCGAPGGEPSPDQAGVAAAIAVSGGWASPTPQGVAVSAGYLTITNATQTQDRLVGVRSPRAGRAEIHEMAMQEGVMRMRPAEGLAIAAGETIALAPGSLHVMFYDLPAPFVVGETIPLTLSFANAGDVETTLPVRMRENAGADDSAR